MLAAARNDGRSAAQLERSIASVSAQLFHRRPDLERVACVDQGRRRRVGPGEARRLAQHARPRSSACPERGAKAACCANRRTGARIDIRTGARRPCTRGPDRSARRPRAYREVEGAARSGRATSSAQHRSGRHRALAAPSGRWRRRHRVRSSCSRCTRATSPTARSPRSARPLIEAQLKVGRQERARAQLERFKARYPRSAYLRRLERLPFTVGTRN